MAKHTVHNHEWESINSHMYTPHFVRREIETLTAYYGREVRMNCF
jgi:hypothetical protein